MPNWCENELTIRSKQGGVLECLVAIRGEPDDEGNASLIDFNRIVPMPKVLEDTTSPPDRFGLFLTGDEKVGQEILACAWAKEKGITTLEELRRYLEQDPVYERYLVLGRQAREAKAETGYYDWHEWCIAHWGTKWNACATQFKEDPTDTKATLYFETAWSPPLPVIAKLSTQFPQLSFTLRYWEGGFGFKGTFRVRNGKILCDDTLSYRGRRGG